MRPVLLTITLLLAATVALAGPPQTGVYLSNDFGGTMLPGRFSESWVNPLASHGQIGNTIHALSWDGLTLGDEWRLLCPSIAAAPVLVSDNRDGNGTGDVTYQTQYGGGTFWMSMNGPWGDGTVDYTGVIQTFVVTTTFQYVFGNVLGIRGNVTMSGSFDGYDNCFDYTVNNTAIVGTTDTMLLPADYPAFRDASCFVGPTRGSWGSVTQIALQIYGSCTVTTEESTWGAVKALYR
ncbi:MAG TPA: hypothetical protein VEC56_01890 [Candidatus Krumholzibacteria bacterium]|nr:hypothetical protein [Candidatus Krumholzibacteria bacterium]